MIKIRATITCVREYEVKEDFYPPGSTVEQIIKIDEQSICEDVLLFLENEDITSKVICEVVQNTQDENGEEK